MTAMVLLRARAVTACLALLVVTVLLGSSARSSYGQGQPRVQPPAGLVAAGKLTYATAATAPPMEFKKDDKYQGFDIEMIETLASYMGLKTEVVNIAFDGLLPALLGKRVDVINSSMYITPARAEQVDFVPYMRIGEAIMVRKGNPLKIHSVDDLSGRTVAVTRGAIEETYTREQNDAFQKAGKPQENVLPFPSALDSALAVEQGRAEVFFTNTLRVPYMLEQRPGVYEVAGIFALKTNIGIAVRKGDATMKKAIDDAIVIFVKSGAYKRLIEKYNFPAEANYF